MSEPHPFALAPGAVFAGRYRITGPADARPSFALYPAVRDDDVRAMLLVLEPGLLRTEALRERFRRDLHACPPMRGVARAIDGAADDAGAWLALKPPWGEALSVAIAQAPLSELDARDALTSIAATLTGMHDAACPHGDLCGESVWYGQQVPRAAVTTLLAPRLGPLLRDAQRLDTVDAPMALTASFAHLAPEAIAGGPEGPAADVWSFALLAYELLAGGSYWKAARDGSSVVRLASEILAEPLAPASERARLAPRPLALPPGFDAWFAGCLARDPAARPSMREAAGGLRALFEGAPLEPPIQPQVILGNPKGSFYDRGLVGPIDGLITVGPPVRPPPVLGNPKGSFYDGGFAPRPRRWPYALAVALLMLAAAAVGAWLARR